MATSVYVGMGSNLGDPATTIQAAAHEVERLGFCARTSSLYRTKPQGGPAQPLYCNAVIMFQTSWRPVDLLTLLQRIERRFGRSRRIYWGPRTLDLDLLLFGDHVIKRRELTIPHPRMSLRRFVLEPLAELTPELKMPDGKTIAQWLENIPAQEVERWS